MFSARVRRYFRLSQIMFAITGVLFGILLSVVSNYLSEQWASTLPWVAALFGVCVVITIVIKFRHPPGVEVVIRSPRTLDDPSESINYARRGFVGFVPSYHLPNQSLSKVEIKQAAADLDFDRLHIEDSNLKPTIHAILSHASRLEHCWLIATSGKKTETAVSLPYAHLLVEYLKQRKNISCEFHYGENYAIIMDNDALVLGKTYDQVRRVFSEAENPPISIPAKEMVANIITGVRSMTLGMVLTSLDGDRDIEFIGTHYDKFGNPTGDLLPITFSFEPKLENK